MIGELLLSDTTQTDAAGCTENGMEWEQETPQPFFAISNSKLKDVADPKMKSTARKSKCSA